MKHLGPFRDLPKLIESDGLISGDKFLQQTIRERDLRYAKRDFVFRKGTWRGIKQRSLISARKEIEDKVLVIGHSDLSTGVLDVCFLKWGLKVRHIFGTNLLELHGASSSIPLGITNYGSDGPFHHLLGDVELFLKADRESGFREHFAPAIYSNFSIQTNTRIRSELVRVLQSLPKQVKVHIASPEYTEQARLSYLSNCRTWTFVVCPEGNGIDTHRLWETLYMGGVPVVLKNKFLEPLVSKFPVVQLNSWDELGDMSLLETKWHEVKSVSWNPYMLHQKYWENMITEKRH